MLVLVVLVHTLLASRASAEEATGSYGGNIGTLHGGLQRCGAARFNRSSSWLPLHYCQLLPILFNCNCSGFWVYGFFSGSGSGWWSWLFFLWVFRSGCWVGVGFVGISFMFVGFGRQAMWGASSSRVWGDSLGQSRCTGKAQQKFARGKGTGCWNVRKKCVVTRNSCSVLEADLWFSAENSQFCLVEEISETFGTFSPSLLWNPTGVQQGAFLASGFFWVSQFQTHFFLGHALPSEKIFPDSWEHVARNRVSMCIWWKKCASN